MKANAKNMTQGLVVSNESPIFALPKNRVVGNIKSYEALLGVFLLHFCSGSRGSLARLGGTPSFYTANCVQQCQRTTQSALARSTVQLRPVATTALWRIAKSFGHILTNPTSFGWKFTVIRRRLFIAMLRLSRPARRYWRLVQQSSSSSDVVLPSASTISLSAAASSPNLKSFAI